LKVISIEDSGAGSEQLKIIQAISCNEAGRGREAYKLRDLAAKGVQTVRNGFVVVGRGIVLLSKTFNGGK
jgi:hypothetical protein